MKPKKSDRCVLFLCVDGGKVVLWLEIRCSCLEVMEQEETSVKTSMFSIQVRAKLRPFPVSFT